MYECQKHLSKAEIDKLKKRIHGKGFPKTANMYFQILANPTRHKIALLLYKEEKLSVCDLAFILEVTPSAVSQHLKHMREIGLVKSTRKGQTIFYSLKNTKFNECLAA